MIKIQNAIIHDKTYQSVFVALTAILVCVWLGVLIIGDCNHYYILNRTDFFCDFVCDWTKTRDPYNWVTKSMDLAGNRCYPPLAYLIFYPFSLFSDASNTFLIGLLFVFLILSTGYALVYFNLLANTYQKVIITVFFVLSSISLFAFRTGNIIILSAVLALIFLFGFDSENKAVREISYIALALSAGMKLYPALFGLLILKRKRYKDAARALFYGLIAFFIPFLFFKGGFGNIPLFLRNVKLFEDMYKYVDHPSFNFKYFANGISDAALRDTVYVVFIAMDRLLLVISMILVFFTKEKWREILLISVSIIWSTIHSGLYMGLFFFAGMVFFLNDAKKSIPNSICCLCIVLILNPLRIVIPNGKDVSNILSNIGCSCLAFTLIIEIIFEIFNGKSH